MDGVLVCAQIGDASTKRPNAPAIADAARALRPVNADEIAVFIVLVNRETSLRSTMKDSFFRVSVAFRISDFHGMRYPQHDQTRRIETNLLDDGIDRRSLARSPWR
jgi:hypothetical protein